ncbi:MAG: hypothetical protein GY820_42450 [Gammaproteobacteria bacterium]|nr:hypothetical protein [Gammaproteobacteria bacterium]
MGYEESQAGIRLSFKGGFKVPCSTLNWATARMLFNNSGSVWLRPDAYS